MILEPEASGIPLAISNTWQQALADVIRQPSELFELLDLDLSQLPAAIEASQDFALRVPRGFCQRMKKGDWHDPLLQQVLPQGKEMQIQPGFSADPLHEAASNPQPGLIHKYQGRVLLIVSGGCAINCRYCFRRHFAYDDNTPGRQQWAQTLEYIANDSSIKEVIFSGGDPLAASDVLLADLVQQLNAIPHLTTLRVHSRMPVVIPQRITDQCLQWLAGGRLKPVMVIHSNHPNELNDEVARSMTKLRQAGVTLLNQSVLLAGINDDPQVLRQLSEKLFAMGVLPYYLHLLDKVQGAAHFEVKEDRARLLQRALLSTLPGYLVPKLVREQPEADSKRPISLF